MSINSHQDAEDKRLHEISISDTIYLSENHSNNNNVLNALNGFARATQFLMKNTERMY